MRQGLLEIIKEAGGKLFKRDKEIRYCWACREEILPTEKWRLIALYGGTHLIHSRKCIKDV